VHQQHVAGTDGQLTQCAARRLRRRDQARGGGEVDAVRLPHEVAERHADQRRVPVEHGRAQHRVADVEALVGRARAEPVDHPGVFLADRLRELDLDPGHRATPDRDVERLYAGRPHPDAHLARPGLRIGQLGDAKDIGRPEAVEDGGSHATTVQPQPGSRSRIIPSDAVGRQAADGRLLVTIVAGPVVTRAVVATVSGCLRSRGGDCPSSPPYLRWPGQVWPSS
jgi:hypothetical protein